MKRPNICVFDSLGWIAVRQLRRSQSGHPSRRAGHPPAGAAGCARPIREHREVPGRAGCLAQASCAASGTSSGRSGPFGAAGQVRLALDYLSAAAVTDDLDALVDSYTKFHEQLIDVSGRRRLKGISSMPDSQMGAVRRSAVERQGIGLMDAVDRHGQLLEAVDSGDVERLRQAIRAH
jgi:hypothetical protein